MKFVLCDPSNYCVFSEVRLLCCKRAQHLLLPFRLVIKRSKICTAETTLVVLTGVELHGEAIHQTFSFHHVLQRTQGPAKADHSRHRVVAEVSLCA